MSFSLLGRVMVVLNWNQKRKQSSTCQLYARRSQSVAGHEGSVGWMGEL